MADTPTFQPNPYANFDPSQWTNPYSKFYGKALPWPSSYAGMPTNAMGQPIAQPPGMTLNSTPAAPAAPAAPAVPQTMRVPNPLAGQPIYGGANPGSNGAWGSVYQGMQPQYLTGQMTPQPQQQAPQAAAPAAGAANNWQQTLSMLANPGPVTTPGATVPQAPSAAPPGPGVLQQFLANWQPSQSGPGSQFQQQFNKALRGG